MPKFFEGTIDLPSAKYTLTPDELTVEHFDSLQIEENKLFCISVDLPGLPESSLGYIFFITKTNGLYSVNNISGNTFFRSIGIALLIKVISHASGVQYCEVIQEEFSRIRTEIGIDQ